ncbi:HtaA domain-containing protein [Actinospica durhamensis]|uniref:HtaA domain-containing protein n=1 Tax=Actinospica durhamensis TaxID=1508375 RepID=A0A941EM89_9ACTN|nr:HtaA domain-containing protein [Actinospica durhamensis]MBR7833122.1 HtaA domain-containing protein [Actinospica durhamensis]
MVRRGSLRWAVKTSFVHYVRMVAAGSVEVLDGAQASPDGVFEFPLSEASEGASGRVLRCAGAVRFSAHHGFLEVDLRDLELSLSANGGELSIAGPEGGRTAIATTDPLAPAAEPGLIRWTGLVPRLTEAGVEVFGNVYPAGTEMAPLEALVLLD